jgi:hypothetical protein
VNQSYSGRGKCRTDVPEATGDLVVSVRCRVGDHSEEYDGLLDTAGYWNVVPPAVALTLGYELDVEGDIRLDSRFGLLSGTLIRLPVIFVADEGEPAEIEAT